MARYFYYSVILCMLTNTILLVPSVMLDYRYSGTIAAIAFGMVSSAVLCTVFTVTMGKFPGKGLPEITRVLPGWVRVPLLAYFAVMWYAASGIALVSYSRALQRFINPSFNIFAMVLFLFLICVWTGSRSTRSIMFGTEIMLLLNVPIMAFILFKALRSELFDWDAIRVITHYSFRLPNWLTICAVTYLSTGYVNMAILNRMMTGRTHLKWLWTIPIMVVTVSCTTFFIPIGIHGTEAVDDYTFPWISTADSMRMVYGFIERVLFVFMLLYLNVSLSFVSLTFHVGTQLLKGIWWEKDTNPDENPKPWFSWLMAAPLGALMLYSVKRMNEKQFFHFTEGWLIIRYASELVLVVLVVGLSLRKKDVAVP